MIHFLFNLIDIYAPCLAIYLLLITPFVVIFSLLNNYNVIKYKSFKQEMIVKTIFNSLLYINVVVLLLFIICCLIYFIFAY